LTERDVSEECGELIMIKRIMKEIALPFSFNIDNITGNLRPFDTAIQCNEAHDCDLLEKLNFKLNFKLPFYI
jgi:hypothetical protein